MENKIMKKHFYHETIQILMLILFSISNIIKAKMILAFTFFLLVYFHIILESSNVMRDYIHNSKTHAIVVTVLTVYSIYLVKLVAISLI